jgi:hypothetical protein
MKLNTAIFRKVKPANLIISTVFMLTALSLPAFAQPPGDPNGGTKPGEDVPITGIEILIAAGGALGLRSLIAKRNKSKE